MHQTFTPPHLPTCSCENNKPSAPNRLVYFPRYQNNTTKQQSHLSPFILHHITTTLFPPFISTYPFPSPHPHHAKPLTKLQTPHHSPQNTTPRPPSSFQPHHPSITRGNPSQETWNSASTPGACTPRASPWIDRWRSGSGIRIGYVASILILIVRSTSLALKKSRSCLLRGALFVSL